MSNFIVGDLPAAKRVNQLSFSDILLPFPPFYTTYSSFMHCDWLKLPVQLHIDWSDFIIVRKNIGL